MVTLMSRIAMEHSLTSQVHFKNGCDQMVKLLSAPRCCAKPIIDVMEVKFQFSTVKLIGPAIALR